MLVWIALSFFDFSFNNKLTRYENKITLFFLLLTLNTISAQSFMDYRSVGTGKWNSLSSWQYYDANNVWRTPTITQGYPGQFSGTGVVTIRDSHVI
jgi:hypothetical protein